MPSDDSHEDLPDPRDELASIVSDLKAYLLWQAELGATGVPRDPDLAERLKENPLPDLSRSKDLGGPAPERARQHADEPGPAPAAPPAAPFRPPRFELPDLSAEPAKRAPTAHKKPLPSTRQSDATQLAALGASLDDLKSRVSGCTLCPLHTERKQTVFSRGTGTSGICFIGEGPGAEEDAHGEPFVGPAGQLLDKMIAAMGLARDEVYICNVVKCRPPDNRRPTPVEMQTCGPYLERQLQLLNPQVIVALGGTAVAGLLGITDGITRVRGRFRLYQGRIAVMPTFHPAYLLRNPSAKREVWSDLQQIMAHIGRPLPSKS